ncbi:MAG: hypothetical protein KatS3mg109_0102 [Pirellulaceae bacterium]|nr:MAG: hypothetical protein KatS3mg109_0102 [Pirellulaceae bacterium]
MAKSPWDGPSPIAFAVKMYQRLPKQLNEAQRQAFFEALDRYGWLDENGEPDYAQADRHFRKSAKVESPPKKGRPIAGQDPAKAKGKGR